MEQTLTLEQAQEAFRAMAALRDEIAFGWLREGCECRAQLMIEHLQEMSLVPGRVWAVSVGRRLTFPHPTPTGRSYKWENHVAPTLSVEGAEHGILVIDPGLSQAGPLTLGDWALAMRVKSFHLSSAGLVEAEILSLHSARALRGEDLDAVLLTLKLGEAPLTNRGGSGFRIGPDPPQGVSAFAHREMRRFLGLQDAPRRERP